MGDSPWADCPETMLIIHINKYYANITVITNHIFNGFVPRGSCTGQKYLQVKLDGC